MTRTMPLRLMILHLLHILLTEALTFMRELSCSIKQHVKNFPKLREITRLWVTVDPPQKRRIIERRL